MLSMYVDSAHKNWDSILPLITYAFNNARHEITGYSPFFLLYARPPRYILDTILPYFAHENESSDEICRAEARRLVRLRTLASQDRSKIRYDGSPRHVYFDPGDLVWLWTPLRKRGFCQKFLAHYVGPYVILEHLSEVNYRIAHLTSSGRR